MKRFSREIELAIAGSLVGRGKKEHCRVQEKTGTFAYSEPVIGRIGRVAFRIGTMGDGYLVAASYVLPRMDEQQRAEMTSLLRRCEERLPGRHFTLSADGRQVEFTDVVSGCDERSPRLGRLVDERLSRDEGGVMYCAAEADRILSGELFREKKEAKERSRGTVLTRMARTLML